MQYFISFFYPVSSSEQFDAKLMEKDVIKYVTELNLEFLEKLISKINKHFYQRMDREIFKTKIP